MDIPRRDVDLDLDPAAVPRDWCGDDTYSTTFMGALSLLFPEGERFFVDAVKQHRHAVTDPGLARAVTGFIGQEAMHGKEHRAFNEVLAAHGHAEAPRIEARLRGFLRFVRRRFSPRSQLAITCALEHFTALLAEQLLREGPLRETLHPTVRPLWTWHALEELEHKAVAFEVYRAAGGGYFRRIGIMILTTFAFFVVQPLTHARLMARRRILWKPWRWMRGIGKSWFWPGYFTRLIPGYFSYYRPRFHPDRRDTTALVAHWREELFGADGTLVAAAA